MRVMLMACLLLTGCGSKVVCDDQGFIVSGVSDATRTSRNLALAGRRLDMSTGDRWTTPDSRAKAEGCP